jgi:hypothetical protein
MAISQILHIHLDLARCFLGVYNKYVTKNLEIVNLKLGLWEGRKIETHHNITKNESIP